MWTGVRTYTHLEILTKFHTIKRNGYHVWHHQQNFLCLWPFTILSPLSIPTSFNVIVQNCVSNHIVNISRFPQDRWASDSCSTPVTAVIQRPTLCWETKNELQQKAQHYCEPFEKPFEGLHRSRGFTSAGSSERCPNPLCSKEWPWQME